MASELATAQLTSLEVSKWKRDPAFQQRDDQVWCRIVEGVLIPSIPDANLVTGRTWKQWFLYLHHNTTVSAHPSAASMKHAISQVAWWPKLGQDIEEWVRKCPACQRLRQEPRRTRSFYRPKPTYDQ